MATITSRKRKDGSTAYRAEVRIKREGRIVHKEVKTFDTRKAAENWGKKREVALKEPGALDRAIRRGSGIDSLTVAGLIERYEEKVSKLKPWTRSKQFVLDRLKKEDIGKLLAVDLSVNDIVEHCVARRDSGAKPQTVAQDYIYLRSVYSVAEDLLGVGVDFSIFDRARPVLRKYNLVARSGQRDRRPEVDEISAIVELAHKTRKKLGRYRDSAPLDKIIVFAMFSSRRLDEICRIRWADIDKKRQTVIVRDMKNPSQKVGNDVECYVPDEAWAVLDSMPQLEGEERVFPFNSRSIGTNFSRLRARAGFNKPEDEDNLKFHDLRHEAISWLFERNGYKRQVWDIPRVAFVSGHQDWKSLQIYEDLMKTKPHDRWEKWEWKTKVLG